MSKETKEVTEEIIERPYELRKIRDRDFITILGLIRRLGLEEFRDPIVKAVNGGDLQEIGVGVVLNICATVIDNLEAEAGDAIYDFVSSMSGIPVEEIKDMEGFVMPLMIYDIINDARNTSFFRVLAKSH